MRKQLTESVTGMHAAGFPQRTVSYTAPAPKHLLTLALQTPRHPSPKSLHEFNRMHLLQASVFFTNPRTALVSCYLYVFATGLLGSLLLGTYMGLNYWWTNLVEVVPAFALYR